MVRAGDIATANQNGVPTLYCKSALDMTDGCVMGLVKSKVGFYKCEVTRQ